MGANEVQSVVNYQALFGCISRNEEHGATFFSGFIVCVKYTARLAYAGCVSSRLHLGCFCMGYTSAPMPACSHNFAVMLLVIGHTICLHWKRSRVPPTKLLRWRKSTNLQPTLRSTTLQTNWIFEQHNRHGW